MSENSVQKENRNVERGFAFYDWGKSAFETSVSVAILPAWFTYLFLEANGLNVRIGSIEMTGDAVWSFAVSGAALLVAVSSKFTCSATVPFLGRAVLLSAFSMLKIAM